jgi:dihydroorotate dehydrogenase electron transfer subunit
VSTTELEPGLSAPEQGPRTLAPFGRRLCRVVANERLGPYDLVAVEDESGPPPLAGQFYMLSSATGWGGDGGRPHLGRAFSVCRARKGRLDFLLEAIGPGTERLGALAPGEDAWVVGPLGIGFRDPVPGGRAVLVGGGIGVAPLVIWEQALRARGTPTLTLLGFRSAVFTEAARLFEGETVLATDDGSGPGHHGLVTDLVEARLASGDELYACGPPPMLEAVRRICATRSVPGQLALEAGMACGFGACFGCVVRTRHGYRRLCVDGPIVAAADLAEGWLG